MCVGHLRNWTAASQQLGAATDAMQKSYAKCFLFIANLDSLARSQLSVVIVVA